MCEPTGAESTDANGSVKYDDLLIREAIFLYWREAAARRRGPASSAADHIPFGSGGISLPRPIIQQGNEEGKGKVV